MTPSGTNSQVKLGALLRRAARAGDRLDLEDPASVGAYETAVSAVESHPSVAEAALRYAGSEDGLDAVSARKILVAASLSLRSQDPDRFLATVAPMLSVEAVDSAPGQRLSLLQMDDAALRSRLGDAVARLDQRSVECDPRLYRPRSREVAPATPEHAPAQRVGGVRGILQSRGLRAAAALAVGLGAVGSQVAFVLKDLANAGGKPLGFVLTTGKNGLPQWMTKPTDGKVTSSHTVYRPVPVSEPDVPGKAGTATAQVHVSLSADTLTAEVGATSPTSPSPNGAVSDIAVQIGSDPVDTNIGDKTLGPDAAKISIPTSAVRDRRVQILVRYEDGDWKTAARGEVAEDAAGSVKPEGWEIVRGDLGAIADYKKTPAKPIDLGRGSSIGDR